MQDILIESATNYIHPKDIQVVCYHYPCSDGCAAAWAAWSLLGNQANYIKIQFGIETPYEQFVGKNVLYVDCALPSASLMKELQETKSCKIMVLDHHETNCNNLSGVEGCYFDMKRSGAMLAWNYFYPGQEPPIFINYIQRRDLRIEETEDGKKFCASFYRAPMTFKVYDECKNLAVVDQYIKKGVKQLKHIEFECKSAQVTCELATFEGHTIVVDKREHNVSDVGEHLLKIQPSAEFVALFGKNKATGKNKVSLRGRTGGVNVGKVAEKYGGGGHAGSASFLTDLDYQELFKTLSEDDDALRRGLHDQHKRDVIKFTSMVIMLYITLLVFALSL